jgi:hypothetical protein
MWFRSLVLATALVSVSLPTFARNNLSDGRKWKVLLPFVRASTDCIAQGIVASPVALNYARQENWLEAVKSMSEECKSLGSRLVAEHDRLYGPGTGKKFVEGPYAADLPRALKARIGPEIQRQTTQWAKAEEPLVPTVAEAETPLQVVETPPPLQSEAPEQEDLRFGVSVPNEAAVRENAVVEEQPAGSVAAPAAELRPGVDRAASSHDEKRFDQAVRPGRAYALTLLAVLAAAALYGAHRIRRWKAGMPQQRPVLIQARRQPVPDSGPGRDRSQVLRGTVHAHRYPVRATLAGVTGVFGTRV